MTHTKNTTVPSIDRTIKQAQALSVTGIESRQLAADLLDAIRAFRKQSDVQKEALIRPLKTAHDQAAGPYIQFAAECQTHEKALTEKLSAYDRECARLAAVEQARLQAITDRANAKIVEKAEAKGIEPVLRMASVVPAPPTTTRTQAGGSLSRITKTVYGVKSVTDNAEIKANDPRIQAIMALAPTLCVFDWVAFRKLASTGMFDGCDQVETRVEFTYMQRGTK